MDENIAIPTTHLFAVLEEKLLSLLSSLTPEEWDKPTIAKLWTVKDVAAHLLDGNLRTISMLRDQYFGETITNENLVAMLNRLNADFVTAMKRVSPALLVQLMEVTGKQYTQLVTSGDPMAPAVFGVSWVGEQQSVNWFHVAREYTERWHHQQQIRDAVNKPGIVTRELYYPVIDTFMRAMPYTYRDTDAPANTVVQVTVSGNAGGDWFLIKKDTWELVKENGLPVTAHTIIDGGAAWKLFTKSWRRTNIAEHVQVRGDKRLAEPVLDMIAVVA